MTGMPNAIIMARHFANVLDTSFTIPFINKRIGVDPLLSLVPYAGSIVSGLLSLYIMYIAWSLGLPGGVLVKMLANILIDVTVGEIPVIGSLIDAMWRSNSKNVTLLEKAYRAHHATVIIP